MKNLFLLLSVVLGLCLTSCNKEDIDPIEKDYHKVVENGTESHIFKRLEGEVFLTDVYKTENYIFIKTNKGRVFSIYQRGVSLFIGLHQGQIPEKMEVNSTVELKFLADNYVVATVPGDDYRTVLTIVDVIRY